MSARADFLGGSPASRRLRSLGVAAFVLLHVLHVAGGLARLPFLSEDWNHLEVAASERSVADALDPAREPLRPLQHLFFHTLARSVAPDPGRARIPALLLFLGSCALVFALARGLGAPRRGAFAAAALFALFPCVEAYAWVAAISGPLRVFFLLAALTAFVSRERRPTRAKGATLVAATIGALLAHESAVLLPLLCLSWVVAGAEGLRDARARVAALIRDPWFAASAALALIWAAYVALRPERHHALRGLEGLPANVVKAAFALFPEIVRVVAVAGFRGSGGTPGFVCAGILFLGVAALVVLLLVRGSRSTRFVVLAVLADAALPVLSTGYVQRYALLSGALAACAIGTAFGRRPTHLGFAAIVLLALAWSTDARGDLEDHVRAAGAQSIVLESARSARDAAPGRPIALVDLPDLVGTERELPLFNWGLRQWFAHERLEGPWLFWRTRAYRTSTDVELVDRARIEAAAGEGVVVLVFEPSPGNSEALGRLVPLARSAAVLPR